MTGRMFRNAHAAALIDDAVTVGARRAIACAEFEISDRTLAALDKRWPGSG